MVTTVHSVLIFLNNVWLAITRTWLVEVIVTSAQLASTVLTEHHKIVLLAIIAHENIFLDRKSVV